MGSWASGGADDGVSGAVEIGFDFCFYGNTYNEVYVGTNGWVSFSPNQPTTFTSTNIPNAGFNVPKNCIMAPWQDWWSTLNGNGNILYSRVGVAPFRKFVVSFVNLPMFSCTQNLGTFQVVLNECNNTIEVYIENKPPCLGWAGGTAVLGLHNITGTVAHTVAGRNSTQWVVVPSNPEGWLFAPDGFCEGGAFGGFATIDTGSVWPVVAADCYTRQIGLKVGSGDLRCSSIEPGGSDFRLYDPKGNLMQIRAVVPECINGRSDSMTLTLAVDFLFNGDHYLVIRNGIDGDPLLGDCGTGANPFDTIIVRVNNCYEYYDQVKIRNVSVLPDNQTLELTWNTPPNFDASFFENYRVYIYDNIPQQSWREIHLGYGIDDTVIYYTMIDPVEESRDFKVTLRMRIYGDINLPADSVNNIWLRAADDKLADGIPGAASIVWTPYKAWSTSFDVYLNAGADSLRGELIGSTSDTTFAFEKPQAPGLYKLSVYTSDGNPMGFEAWSNFLFFEIETREVVVPNVITPNGDGANDFFFVEGLEFFPKNRVSLFNRWGQRVFESEDYTNDYSPVNLESGTYIYMVEIPDKPLVQGALRIIK
ncbi:MAG: gliding motility-associated C-terminal domain-containing protein [Bacteroidia bacterium]